jgi:hypothetical protein
MCAGVSYVDKQFVGQKYDRCGKLDTLERLQAGSLRGGHCSPWISSSSSAENVYIDGQ